jgi:hypothetical protein
MIDSSGVGALDRRLSLSPLLSDLGFAFDIAAAVQTSDERSRDMSYGQSPTRCASIEVRTLCMSWPSMDERAVMVAV